MLVDTNRGVFVVLEGGEGAGKSTQIAAVARMLEREGREVVTCREPGGTPVGERLREALFATTDDEAPPTPETELLIFNAARAQLVREVIVPALDRGAVVLCDRFTGSTVAYQHYGRRVPRPIVDAANAVATGGLLPDLVVLLMLEPEQGFERTGRGRDYLERAGIEFHRDVARGFLEQAAADPDHWLVLDASRPEMQITHAILERLRALIS
ncbi:MAG: dTMP kinase [Dehalococcoidia bacterium]|nr:dTMP kinase [Dehalococcoidia bacterium]MCB9482447.1 dTMP kinase [Dehalococcoidia bacterium]MCB9491266.1 dTMP kinase [Dehalococcoidia bacterium]